MKRLLYFFPFLFLLNGCFYIPLSDLATEETEAKTPQIPKPDNYFLSVQYTGETLVPDSGDKNVLVSIEVENGDPKQVDFKGFFSPHMAKIADKSNLYKDVTMYAEDGKDFDNADLKRPVFASPPFEPGEKRTFALAFTVPKAAKVTKVYIPHQSGGSYLDLKGKEIKP
jgi:hypothetical protein